MQLLLQSLCVRWIIILITLLNKHSYIISACRYLHCSKKIIFITKYPPPPITAWCLLIVVGLLCMHVCIHSKISVLWWCIIIHDSVKWLIFLMLNHANIQIFTDSSKNNNIIIGYEIAVATLQSCYKEITSYSWVYNQIQSNKTKKKMKKRFCVIIAAVIVGK